MQINPVDIKTPKLSLMERQALVTSIFSVLNGLGEVTVSLTYDKQTNTRPRIAGEDYIKMPGIDPKAQIGRLEVYQYVDNRANRKLGRVGKIYLKVATMTRSNGESPTHHANLRPEGITGFAITGFVPNTDAGPSNISQG